MRFSSILASLAAASAVSGAPLFLPVGNLPSQTTSAALVLKDLATLKGAIAELITAVQGIIDFKKQGLLDGGAKPLDDVFQKTVAYQIATQTARLNANGIDGTFRSDDSTAIADELKNSILPDVTTVTGLLKSAKDLSILGVSTSLPGILGSILWPLGLDSYLDYLTKDTTGFNKALLPHLSESVRPDANTTMTSINGLLNATYAVYTTREGS